MSNEKGTNNKKRRTPPPQRPKKKKYADDRTPAVKKVDRVCKVLAIVLSLLFFANVHVLVRGGGRDDAQAVTVLGLASGRLETQVMESEIEAKSAVFTKKQAEYDKGDVVRYFDGETNSVKRVTDVTDDGQSYTVVGDNESDSEAVTIKSEDISGKVFLSSKALYGFIKIYVSALGAALTVLLSFLMLMMSDILMYKKRRANARAKREAYEKKQARKLQVRQGIEGETEKEEVVNPIEKRRAEKQAKLEKERAEIAAEMKELQKKMKAEENELKSGKRGKK